MQGIAIFEAQTEEALDAELEAWMGMHGDAKLMGLHNGSSHGGYTSVLAYREGLDPTQPK